MRTRLAQKNADSAPDQDIVIRPPSSAGRKKLTTTSIGKIFSIFTSALSASRSGANRCWLVCSRRTASPRGRTRSP